MLSNQIREARDFGAPASVLRRHALACRHVDLLTKEGMDFSLNRSPLAAWCRKKHEAEREHRNAVRQAWHERQAARERARKQTVYFSWDYEDVGDRLVRHVHVYGAELPPPLSYDSWEEIASIRGIADTRQQVKKAAKAAGLQFKDETEVDMAYYFKSDNLRKAKERDY
jgi:hypothetical protein